MQRPPTRLFIFEDAVICGMGGGAIAALLGAPFIVSAMLCAMAGPLVIFGSNILLDAIPHSLPGREYGVYEFLSFAICVVIAVAIYKLAT